MIELVCEGDGAKMMRGSDNTRHSHSVHTFGRNDAKRDTGDGRGGGRDARICRRPLVSVELSLEKAINHAHESSY